MTDEEFVLNENDELIPKSKYHPSFLPRHKISPEDAVLDESRKVTGWRTSHEERERDRRLVRRPDIYYLDVYTNDRLDTTFRTSVDIHDVVRALEGEAHRYIERKMQEQPYCKCTLQWNPRPTNATIE